MAILPATSENLERAAEIIRSGGVVAFPTETVYGLGANAFDPIAVARIFEIKRRPSFDPLIVHVGSDAMLDRVADCIPARARLLMERFWPGPLTIVLRKRDAVPALVTSGLPTVAVRMPAHPVARELIARAGVAVAAPSANPFGRLSPTRAQHVQRMLGSSVDAIVDGGATEFGLESTVVSLEPQPAILRPGAVVAEQLEAALGLSFAPAGTATRPLAPGQLPHHYAPRTPLRIVDFEDVPAQERVGAGIVTLSRRAAGYAQARRLSERGDLREAAARLFETLHELDELGLRRIDVEPVGEAGLGAAIMDRLRRASCD
ncbi:MAG TPA: L-threonylcarbamoyladenylate synthase [Candidatus Tumulicola sp.]|nr:L-threonylcarbamoyladenylate synthase [Candidatus Tumulicola sp.]